MSAPATVTAAAAPAAACEATPRSLQRSGPHPALTRPALLSHIFKFAVREHKDVKLLHVHSAWEDTAVNYSPLLWRRLVRARGTWDATPPEAVATVEELSRFLAQVPRS